MEVQIEKPAPVGEMAELEERIFEALTVPMDAIASDVMIQLRQGAMADLELVNRDGVWAGLLVDCLIESGRAEVVENGRAEEDPELRSKAREAFGRLRAVIRNAVESNLDEYLLTVGGEFLTVLHECQLWQRATAEEEESVPAHH